MEKIIPICAVLGAVFCVSSTRLADARPRVQPKTPDFIVCIDPGHPSEVSDGAIANGLSENTLNWQVAQKLAARLDQLEAQGITYVMTKKTLHQRVKNQQRAEIANGANKYGRPCALFIRLHCDVGSGSGYSWYYPDLKGRQGRPSRKVQVASRHAALILDKGMRSRLRNDLKSNPVKTDASTFVGARQGGVLTGSIHSKVPTALLEMCYINNRRDAEFISSLKGQEQMAQALTDGIILWRANYQKYWRPQ